MQRCDFTDCGWRLIRQSTCKNTIHVRLHSTLRVIEEATFPPNIIFHIFLSGSYTWYLIKRRNTETEMQPLTLPFLCMQKPLPFDFSTSPQVVQSIFIRLRRQYNPRSSFRPSTDVIALSNNSSSSRKSQQARQYLLLLAVYAGRNSSAAISASD